MSPIVNQSGRGRYHPFHENGFGNWGDALDASSPNEKTTMATTAAAARDSPGRVKDI